MVGLQEELDWQALAKFGLAPASLVIGTVVPEVNRGERAFEIALAQSVASGRALSTWFERHGISPIVEVPARWPTPYQDVVRKRIELLAADVDVGFVERPEHKRRWAGPSWNERQRDALVRLVLTSLDAPELWRDLRPMSTSELTDALRQSP